MYIPAKEGLVVTAEHVRLSGHEELHVLEASVDQFWGTGTKEGEEGGWERVCMCVCVYVCVCVHVVFVVYVCGVYVCVHAYACDVWCVCVYIMRSVEKCTASNLYYSHTRQ